MDDDPLIGTVLADRYRVEELVGVGAMGRVYRAEHVHMRKTIALKILHSQLTQIPDMVQRFEHEAQAAARIQHPHVAAATDFGKLPDGSVYLALEYIEGLPLSEEIKKGPLDPRRVLDIVGQVSSALEAAHAHEIVHRDLKPDNLLLVDGEQGDFVKILDFGVAKVPTEQSDEKQRLTLAGVVYGTPEYMAPEQALGQPVDGRADIYALGVVAYEMLTGRRPYVGPVGGLLGQQLSQPVPKMSDVGNVFIPTAVEQMVVEMLSTDPKRRPETAAVVREQVEALEQAWSEGKLAGATRGSSALLSASLEEVTGKIGVRLQTLPEPVQKVASSRTSRVGFISLAFVALGIAFAVVAIETWDRGRPKPEQVRLQAPPPPIAEEPQESPELGSRLDAAKAQGLPALLALAEQFPAEGIIVAELSLEYAKNGQFEEALTAARSALALDPQLNEHPKIAGALFRATQSPSVRAACFRFLRGPMGAPGVSIIYDLAETEAVNARVRAEARILLEKDEIQQMASPAVRLLLSLKEAKSCEQYLPLVEQAALVGDKRALPFLERLTQTTGCGPKRQGDCYSCLRESSALPEAIAKLKQRATLVEPSQTEAGSSN